MIYRSPDVLPVRFFNHSIFIAGGISNCPDWQSDIIPLIDSQRYDIINPRRSTGFDHTGDTAVEQITWEFNALERVNSCLFWFPEETLCPITLFELGKMLVKATLVQIEMIVGWHPNYARGFDLDVQISLMEDKFMYPVRYAEGWDNFSKFVQAKWG